MLGHNLWLIHSLAAILLRNFYYNNYLAIVISLLPFSVHRDFEVVGHFLPVVLNLPSNCHVAVRHTSIKLVGELAEWIEKHPEYLGRQMYAAYVKSNCLKNSRLGAQREVFFESLSTYLTANFRQTFLHVQTGNITPSIR